MAERDDEKYQIVASELYRLNVDRLKVVMGVQADYGKWLIATLSLVHTAALYALATSLFKTVDHTAAIPFLLGLLLTLSSGLSSWVNFTIVMTDLHNSTDPHMIFYDERWPKLNKRIAFWAKATMFIAVATGILSALCIFWGAAIILFR